MLPPQKTPSPLPPVEHQVLSLVCRGYRDSHIAETLSISNSAVKNHVRGLLRKFEVSDRLELVFYAAAHGLYRR